MTNTSNAGNSQKSSTLIKAAPLWAKSSVKGGQYLTGRLGGVKVLVMENRDRKSDDDPSHTLFFVEAPDRRQGGQQLAQERSGGVGALPRHRGRARRSQRRSVGASRRRHRSKTMRRSGRGDGPAIWGILKMDDKRSLPHLCISTEHLR
jgi:hypothetical protein